MNFPKITATFAAVVAITLGASLFVACGDDGESTKAKDSPTLGGDSLGCSITKLKDKDAHKVECDGDSIGVMLDGVDRLPEADTITDTVKVVERDTILDTVKVEKIKNDTLYMVRNDTVFIEVESSEGGEEVAEGCVAMPVEGESGHYKILCGEDLLGVFRNTDEDASCSAEPVNGGYSIICDGETIVLKQESASTSGGVITLANGKFLDTRNGIIYKTVTIGAQTWMAENLNYDDSVSTPNLKGGNWCYDNKGENCEIYGRLYTWTAAMNLDSMYNEKHAGDLVQTKHQGICPNGWHIPDSTEWNTLVNYVDGLDDEKNNEGYWLKTQYGWDDYVDGISGNGIDGVGFSALPVGWHYAEF
ncbi:MAG: hypothetical protein HUK20_06685, partial [Fibrobacter sp.]|nr:hypothetical protein [Fibrobacter sp.]